MHEKIMKTRAALKSAEMEAPPRTQAAGRAPRSARRRNAMVTAARAAAAAYGLASRAYQTAIGCSAHTHAAVIRPGRPATVAPMAMAAAVPATWNSTEGSRSAISVGALDPTKAFTRA